MRWWQVRWLLLALPVVSLLRASTPVAGEGMQCHGFSFMYPVAQAIEHELYWEQFGTHVDCDAGPPAGIQIRTFVFGLTDSFQIEVLVDAEEQTCFDVYSCETRKFVKLSPGYYLVYGRLLVTSGARFEPAAIAETTNLVYQVQAP